MPPMGSGLFRHSFYPFASLGIPRFFAVVFRSKHWLTGGQSDRTPIGPLAKGYGESVRRFSAGSISAQDGACQRRMLPS